MYRQAYRCRECGNVHVNHAETRDFPLYIYDDCDSCSRRRTHVKNDSA